MKLQNMKKKRGTTEITSEGQIRNFGTEQIPQRLCSNINYSSILSRLIVEAGKRCEAYASDLFISWESMLNDISKIEENTNLTYYFGIHFSFGCKSGYGKELAGNGIDTDTVISIFKILFLV